MPILSISKLSKTYASGFTRPARHRPRDRAGRDLRAARPERRRQDDADQHRLRHRARRAPARCRSTATTSSRDYRAARAADRARAAGADHRRVRDGVGHRQLQPRPVRQAANPAPYRAGAARPVALGQARQPDHDAVGRHEAPGADRQGAVARAPDPVPRRADGRRRRRAAPGHVAPGARPARSRASPSSSRPTTSRRPRRWPTASA